MRRANPYFYFLLLGLGLSALACGPVTPEAIDCSKANACGDHGSCVDNGAGDECVCDTGWTGNRCDQCVDGFEIQGGDCVPANSCASQCAAQGRTCIGVEGDIVCGGCLDGWYEQDGRCYQACAAESNPGEIVPVDLYIMLDQSASMSDDGKWNAVVAALQSFVNASDTSGIGVGLQFFPLPMTGSGPPTSCSSDTDCGLYGPCVPVLNQCNGAFSSDSCDPADYEDADVPIQTLPGVQSAILSALNNAGPNGDSTPTQPAFDGAVTYATAWAQAHPDHLTFIVFATDGEPTNCTYNSIADTADLATGAADGDPSVKTFVIGVGETLDSLNTIAAAGGTSQAYLVDTGGNVTQQFIDVLNEVRANGLCKYQIPQPEQGTADTTKINVSLVDPAAPTTATTLFNVGTESGCDPVNGGWYYDDPVTPQLILLCPATCTQVQLDNLEVNILVGCQTVVR